jgi:hypothetical protein
VDEPVARRRPDGVQRRGFDRPVAAGPRAAPRRRSDHSAGSASARFKTVTPLSGAARHAEPMSVRLRYTILYGVLFLISGIGLLSLFAALSPRFTGRGVFWAPPSTSRWPGPTRCRPPSPTASTPNSTASTPCSTGSSS